MCCDGLIDTPFDDSINQVLDAGKDINDTVINAIDQAGTGLDDAVNDNIPGGWKLPAAIAVAYATGYVDPSLFGAELAGEAAVGSELAALEADAAIMGEIGAGGAGAGAGVVGSELAALEADAAIQGGLSSGTSVGTSAGAGVASELETLAADEALRQTAEQTALDSLVAQQSDLYPAIGNNIISLPKIASGAGKGMLTNAGMSLLTGRPITPQGLITAGVSGGLGGGVADITGSNYLGGLSAAGTNALLNKSLSPTTMASAIPQIGAGISNSGSQASTSEGTAGGALNSTFNNMAGNINAVQPTNISTGTGLQTGSLLKNTKILQDLKNMYPQLNQVNPQLMAQLGYPVEGNLPSTASQPTPQQAQPNYAEQNSNMYKTILANQGADAPLLGMKSGGHVPEFITGHTGHYASGEGDGQSDDIKALLNEGDYVIDAESVAQLGNGSSKAGRDILDQFRGSVPYSQHHASGGKIPAMIADGEYVLPSGFVSALGNGSSDKGAKQLDSMRKSLREHKRSAPLNKIPPKSKSPLEYLQEGIKMKERR